MSCRACKSDRLEPVIDLGMQPLPNQLRQSRKDWQRYYPLEVVRCEDCDLMQTAHDLPREHVFIHIDCDLCRGRSYDLLFDKEGFHHVRCRDCGMVFVNPRLSNHGELQKSEGTASPV